MMQRGWRRTEAICLNALMERARSASVIRAGEGLAEVDGLTAAWLTRTIVAALTRSAAPMAMRAGPGLRLWGKGMMGRDKSSFLQEADGWAVCLGGERMPLARLGKRTRKISGEILAGVLRFCAKAQEFCARFARWRNRCPVHGYET